MPIVEMTAQHLERNTAIERTVEGFEHHSHTASAQLAEDQIAAQHLPGRGNLEQRLEYPTTLGPVRRPIERGPR